MNDLPREPARGWEGMHSPEQWVGADAETLFGWMDIGMAVTASPGSSPNPLS